jgi:tetratricopeptide (TPR) repeat protein
LSGPGDCLEQTNDNLERITCLENYLLTNDDTFDNDVFTAIYQLCLSHFQDSQGTYCKFKVLKAFGIIIEKSSKISLNSENKSYLAEIHAGCNGLAKETQPNDIVKALALYCVGLLYYNEARNDNNPDSYKKAIIILEKYLSLLNFIPYSEREKLRYNTIKALYYKARSHTEIKEYRDCIIMYLNQLGQIKDGGYGTGSYRTFYNIGLNYYRLGESHKALIYFFEALSYLNTRIQRDKHPTWLVVIKYEMDITFVKKNDRKYEESDTLLQIGLAYKKLSNYSKAKEIYKMLINRYSDYVETYNRGGQYLDVNNAPTPKAKEKAKDREVDLYYIAKNNLAMTHAETKEFDDAWEQISFVAQNKVESKGYVEAFMIDTVGYILYKEKHYKKALEFFRKAIQIDNTKKIYFFHQGNCYLKMEKYEEAIESYTTSDSLDRRTKYPEALNNRGVAYHKSNKKDLAISDFRQILETDYHNTPAHYNLLKLTSGESGLTSFWEYWKHSTARKITAVFLISFIFVGATLAFIAPYGGPLLYSFLDNQNEPISFTTEVTNISTLQEDRSFTTVKNYTKESATPMGDQDNRLNLAIVGAIVVGVLTLILLSPIIRSAKVGTTSFELTLVDIYIDKPIELEFVEG